MYACVYGTASNVATKISEGHLLSQRQGVDGSFTDCTPDEFIQLASDVGRLLLEDNTLVSVDAPVKVLCNADCYL